jgi:hypothetical protein
MCVPAIAFKSKERHLPKRDDVQLPVMEPRVASRVTGAHPVSSITSAHVAIGGKADATANEFGRHGRKPVIVILRRMVFQRLPALGVTSMKRMEALPDVPR